MFNHVGVIQDFPAKSHIYFMEWLMYRAARCTFIDLLNLGPGFKMKCLYPSFYSYFHLITCFSFLRPLNHIFHYQPLVPSL